MAAIKSESSCYEDISLVFTGIDIDEDGKKDFGVATVNEDKTVMTVTDKYVDGRLVEKNG